MNPLPSYNTYSISVVYERLPCFDRTLTQEDPGDKGNKNHALNIETHRKHYLLYTYNLALGPILARCSSWSWGSSCTGRTSVPLLSNFAFCSLQQQENEMSIIKGWRKRKSSINNSQQNPVHQEGLGFLPLHPHPRKEEAFNELKQVVHASHWFKHTLFSC